MGLSLHSLVDSIRMIILDTLYLLPFFGSMDEKTFYYLKKCDKAFLRKKTYSLSSGKNVTVYIYQDDKDWFGGQKTIYGSIIINKRVLSRSKDELEYTLLHELGHSETNIFLKLTVVLLFFFSFIFGLSSIQLLAAIVVGIILFFLRLNFEFLFISLVCFAFALIMSVLLFFVAQTFSEGVAEYNAVANMSRKRYAKVVLIAKKRLNKNWKNKSFWYQVHYALSYKMLWLAQIVYDILHIGRK